MICRRLIAAGAALHRNPDGYLARSLIAIALDEHRHDTGLAIGGGLSGKKLAAGFPHHARRRRAAIACDKDEIITRSDLFRQKAGETGKAGGQYRDDWQSRHGYNFHSQDKQDSCPKHVMDYVAKGG
jgi:hypothetical protein